MQERREVEFQIVEAGRKQGALESVPPTPATTGEVMEYKTQP